jgi:MYXO-CTERM domain-containing protein
MPTTMKPRSRDRTPAQWYCLVAGLLLALRGAEQLVVGASFAMPGEGWRAAQQLLTGILLLLAQRNRLVAYRALAPFAIFYGVLAVVGDINGHEAFGLITVDGRDTFVNPLYAALALLILGLGARRRR